MTEHEHQVAVIRWAELTKAKHPELRLLHSVPNGGYRRGREAKRLKAEGVRPGVPDLCFPVARGGFHGLYIEMKKPKCAKSRAGTLSLEQSQWLNDLADQGYLAVVCVGFEAAINTLESYLSST